jgi:hypothetical protein
MTGAAGDWLHAVASDEEMVVASAALKGPAA